MKSDLSAKDGQLLSDFLDGQLSPQETARLQKRLSEDETLRKVVEELRQLKIILRSSPRYSVPHNFTLTPAMVKKNKFEILLPVLRFSSAAAVFLLVASYLLELLPGGVSTLRMSAVPLASTPAPEALAAKNIVESPPPPIILWNEGSQPGLPAEGRGGGSGPVILEAQPSEKQMNTMVLPTTSGAAQPELLAPQALPQATQGPNQFLPAAPDQNPNPKMAPVWPSDMATSEAPLSSASPSDEEAPLILGIRPTDERAMILTPEVRQPVAIPFAPVTDTQNQESNFWMWVKLVLAAAALSTGIGAVLLQRKIKK